MLIPPCTTQDLEGTVPPMWDNSLFNARFGDELDACPELVRELYAVTLEEGIVTLDSLEASTCGDWLAYEESCYFKSSYLDVSMDWADASGRRVSSRTLRRFSSSAAAAPAFPCCGGIPANPEPTPLSHGVERR